MTPHERERLDAAVAKAAGYIKPLLCAWTPADKLWSGTPSIHPSKDWTVLMRAVAKLEERTLEDGILRFTRCAPGLNPGTYGLWQVSWGPGPNDGASYLFGWEHNVSETEALALCIAACIGDGDGN